MESYRDFARVYDEFMDQTPYDEWLLNILNIFKEYKIDKDTVLTSINKLGLLIEEFEANNTAWLEQDVAE